MSRTAGKDRCILLIADRSLSEHQCRRLRDLGGNREILLLDLSADEGVAVGDVPVRRLRIDARLDLDRFHVRLLEFLDRWPRETLVDGRPFADVFRHTTGHSLWWTGPGSQRHPFSGPIVPTLKAVSIARTAIDIEQPEQVVTTITDRRVAMLLPRLCAACNVSHLPLSRSRTSQASSRQYLRWWFARATLALLALPVWIVIRAAYARIVIGARNAKTKSSRSSVVMSGWHPNHVRDDDTGRPHVIYWQRLTDVLRQRDPGLRVSYLLHTTTYRFAGWKRFLRPLVTGWSGLRHVDGLLPLSQCHPQLRPYGAAARHQWRLMQTYARFEQSGELQDAPLFAGIDVSPLLIPHLRAAVGTMAKWSRNVAACAQSLRQAGSARVVLVHEEFYPKGMLTIAAAQSLGIPTIGVQHGLIGPQHTVYMPPPGHVRDAPSPDWFAAYGASVIPILSEVGRYPRERIRVVGAPRFDELASSPRDRRGCRNRLGWLADQSVILVTTETYRLSSPILRALIPLAREHPDWRIVVKLHPHDREPHRYNTLLDDARCSNIELVHDRLPERIAACDVLVTGYSTTAIEGLLAGRHVVCADFTTAPDRYPFVAEAAALGARSEHELRAALAQLLAGGFGANDREDFLRRHLGPTVGGQAADEFASWIVELLRRSASSEVE